MIGDIISGLTVEGTGIRTTTKVVLRARNIHYSIVKNWNVVLFNESNLVLYKVLIEVVQGNMEEIKFSLSKLREYCWK